MTFAKPTTTDNFEEKIRPKPCSRCYVLSDHDNLIKYGSFCPSCYKSYCQQAPNYPHELNTHKGDPRGWAKRIIEKHNAGKSVSSIALRFAKEALS
jgi:hypothetical protein